MTFFGLSYSTFGGDLYGSLCGNENNILICLPFVFGKISRQCHVTVLDVKILIYIEYRERVSNKTLFTRLAPVVFVVVFVYIIYDYH